MMWARIEGEKLLNGTGAIDSELFMEVVNRYQRQCSGEESRAKLKFTTTELN
jgi:hypothetical protein